MNLKNQTNHTGYDPEELYFEKLNRELINKLKAEKSPEATEPKQELAKVIHIKPREISQKKAA